MQARHVVGHEMQAGLDAMKHLVRERHGAVDAVVGNGLRHQHRPPRALPLGWRVGDDHLLGQRALEDAVVRMQHPLRIRPVRHREAGLRVDQQDLAVEPLSPQTPGILVGRSLCVGENRLGLRDVDGLGADRARNQRPKTDRADKNGSKTTLPGHAHPQSWLERGISDGDDYVCRQCAYETRSRRNGQLIAPAQNRDHQTRTG